MRTLIAIIITASATAYAGYTHGFYVGKLDAQANTNALIDAGYSTPQYIDSIQPTYIGN